MEGTRVVLDERGSWRCEGRACQPGHPCNHVGQAQRFRQMRGMKLADDETVELEPETFDPVISVVPTRERRQSPWAVVLAAVGIAGLSSGITYVAATSRTQDVSTTGQPQPVAAPPVLPTPEPAPLPPVRIVNEFDPAEVFEFPGGMSESEARQAAAELLLERARLRLASR